MNADKPYKTVRGAANFIKKNPKILLSKSVASRETIKFKYLLKGIKKGYNIAIPKDFKTAGLKGKAFEDPVLSNEFRKKAEKDYPRKKLVFSGNPLISCGEEYRQRDEPFTYRGKFKGYKNFNLYYDYQSALIITKSGGCAYLIQKNKLVKKIVAPRGMVFQIDGTGILLKRISDGMDFHPENYQFKAKNFAYIVRAAMADNFKKRLIYRAYTKKQAKIEKIFKRDISNTYVNLLDSKRAGNCIEGSLTFAEKRLGINRDEIIKNGYLFQVNAERLIKVDPNNNRVLSAVRAAWNRETTVSI